ncbi:MAG TPA: hypothetical protein VGM27_15895 [Acidobacteriaceae bacterium]|jgi:hypothetical protein
MKSVSRFGLANTPQSRAIRSWRWLLIGTAAGSLAVFYWFSVSGLPRTPPYHLIVEFDHLKAARQPLEINDSRLGPDIARTVQRLNLNAVARGGSGGAEYIPDTPGRPTVRILILAQEPVSRSAELSVPQSGNIVYLLRNQQWEPHPAEAAKIPAQETIRIIPDKDQPGAFEATLTGVAASRMFTFRPSWDEVKPKRQ